MAKTKKKEHFDCTHCGADVDITTAQYCNACGTDGLCSDCIKLRNHDCEGGNE